jgi:uncharacterized protein (TIGR01777 family)
METVLIAGGSGLVGQRLSQKLQASGYAVRHLSRSAKPMATFPAFAWNPDQGQIDLAAFDGVTKVINLAGSGIADARWTDARKKDLIDSRTQSVNLLLSTIAAHAPQVDSFVSASAVGFYGNTGDAWVTEDSPAQKGNFLSDTCQVWEDCIFKTHSYNPRKIALRIGIVLSKDGGALAKMLPSYMARMGAYFGDGQQFMPWIHIDDVADMFIFALTQGQAGIYNCCAPEPVSSKTMAYAIAEAKEQKALIVPAPAFALRLAMGEMADVVLHGSRPSAQKIMDAGFQFKHPNLVEALRDLKV